MIGSFDDLTAESLFSARPSAKATFVRAAHDSAFLRDSLYSVPGLG